MTPIFLRERGRFVVLFLILIGSSLGAPVFLRGKGTFVVLLFLILIDSRLGYLFELSLVP